MDVSENNGTPKSSTLIGFSLINHPFWGTTIFGNIQIFHHEFQRKSQAIPTKALPEGFATPSRNSPGFFGSLHRYHSSTVLSDRKFQIERRWCVYTSIVQGNPKISNNPCASKSLKINISDLKSTTTDHNCSQTFQQLSNERN